MYEARRREQRRPRQDQNTERGPTLPSKPLEQQVRGGNGKADQNRSVQIRPQRDQRHEQPDGARRLARLTPKQQDGQREQRQREQLRAHDEQRRERRKWEREQR